MFEKYRKTVKKVSPKNAYFSDGEAGPILVPNDKVKSGKEYIVLPIVSGG